MNLKQRALLDLAEHFNVPPIYSLEQARHVSAIFAVRSDSPEEDTDTKSNAGKFHTELCVQRDELDEAVEKVSFSAGGYFIQEMIEAQFSAVATTRGDELTITLNNGLCEGITSGRVMGITYKFNLKDKVSKVGKQMLLN
jgi:phosphoenolpyruvate synthase/pyruvate phosphate dikinase